MGKFLVTFLVANCFLAISGSESSLTLQRREQLDGDGKYLLAWEYDETTGVILFEVEAETTGFVGFGISPQGSMTNADIFIAGVFENGTKYGNDYFGTGPVPPTLDAHQDWTLLDAREFFGKTYLKFSRPINSCDEEEDYPIGMDTTRIIWSMGETDALSYHKQNRGIHSVNLLGLPMPEIDLEGLQTWNMTVEIEMPKLDTTYWCSFHKAPVLSKKHHIVAFDAFINSVEALRHTHHFILYNCYLPPNHNQTLEEVFGNYTVDTGFNGGLCFPPEESTQPPMPVAFCTEYLYVWAKGGKMMTFPEIAGYPIGDGENANKQLYHMLEIHYDNPEEAEGVTFRTGVHFYYTENTRQEDAGLLAVGSETNIMITVPPNMPNYVQIAHCSPFCTEWGIEEGGMTIFNGLLHAHMSGRKLKLRQFRDGKEVPWIGYDDHYDFDYQQNAPMPPTMLYPGDHLTYECTYDSTWNEGKVVVGGISSREEMCQTFLWYYPRQRMDHCYALYPFDLHFEEFGITEYHEEMTSTGMNIIVIDEPEYLRGPYSEAINKFNWSSAFIEEYQARRLTGGYQNVCINSQSGDWNYTSEITYPCVEREYAPVDVCNPNPTTEEPKDCTPQSTPDSSTPEPSTPEPSTSTSTPSSSTTQPSTPNTSTTTPSTNSTSTEPTSSPPTTPSQTTPPQTTPPQTTGSSTGETSSTTEASGASQFAPAFLTTLICIGVIFSAKL